MIEEIAAARSSSLVIGRLSIYKFIYIYVGCGSASGSVEGGRELSSVGILILIRLDGAEGEILRGSGALGEDVEKGGLAHVGNANDSDPQIGTDPSDQRLALRLVVLLRRHFWIIWRVWESSILVNIFNLFLSIFGSRGGHNLTRRSPLVLTSCGAALLLG